MIYLIINFQKYVGIKNAQLFAFDSFQGLPETSKQEDGVFEKGTFNTAIEEFTSLVKKKSGLKLDNTKKDQTKTKKQHETIIGNTREVNFRH